MPNIRITYILLVPAANCAALPVYLGVLEHMICIEVLYCSNSVLYRSFYCCNSVVRVVVVVHAV